MNNRIKWQRPQALLFSNNPGTLTPLGSEMIYVPNGTEGEDFIILSDHNRAGISASKQRIETRSRMVNGTMRSYHTADKLNISTSWSRLPSRAYDSAPIYNVDGVRQDPLSQEYTSDGGAGGADLLAWYEDHPGPFWVFSSYDNLGDGNLNRYTNVLQMYFAGFDYEVEKRGQSWSNGNASGFDMWNVSMSLEEV